MCVRVRALARVYTYIINTLYIIRSHRRQCVFLFYYYCTFFFFYYEKNTVPPSLVNAFGLLSLLLLLLFGYSELRGARVF